MHLNNRLANLLYLLPEDKFVVTNEIAKKLKLSSRTIRTLINELNGRLKNNGAHIESRRGKGLRLVISDRSLYESFVSEKRKVNIPENSEERFQYILSRLITSKDYIKAETFCESMYISKKTLSLELKKIDDFLDKYNLFLERKPHYGLLVVGREFSFRNCLSFMIHKLDKRWLSDILGNFEDAKKIRLCLLESINDMGYTLYEDDIPNIVLEIQIMLYRISLGFITREADFDIKDYAQESDIKLAIKLADRLNKMFSCKVKKSEIKYLALQLLGKKKYVGSARYNVFIDMEINQLVNKMIKSVNDAFDLDLSKNFDLNTFLRTHMVSLRIRLLYNMRINNPILSDIKEFYGFPYAVAAHASTILSKYFKIIVSEEEIGYLALIFALALKKDNIKKYKRNILLVCASGAGSSKLFEHKFRNTFSDYLDEVKTCDLSSISSIDFSNIDFVFTTIPIKNPLPVPICQIQYFFDIHNINEVSRILKNKKHNSIAKYFKEELFFTDVTGSDRDEVLMEICSRIRLFKNLPENFEESVLEREELMQTDFWNNIAIPHPYKPLTKETFVSVAILDKPILWHMHNVQIVFLLSISNENDDLEIFYNTAPKIMMEEKYINRIIKEKSYETLLEIIDEVEKNIS